MPSTASNFTKSTPRRRGRPQAKFRCADSREIIGLVRQASGRWRISATGERFFEPDELLAVARFEAVMAKLRGEDTVKLPLPPQPTFEAAVAAAQEAGGARFNVKLRPDQPPEYSVLVGSAAFYAAVRKMLIDDARALSLKTGVEWVRRGADLPKPQPSTTLKSIGDAYAEKPGLSTNEASRSRLFWHEFMKAVEVTTVRELDHDLIGKYEAAIRKTDLLPKSILHRFRKIRTILAYAIKRGNGVEDCRRALDITAMLEVPDHTPLDPQPITPEQFHAVHKAAVKAKDQTFAALLMLSLNCAMYASEAGAAKWDEINLPNATLVTRRPKTGVSRIATLWPETVKALNGIPRRGEYVFYTTVRSYTVQSALERWRRYCDAAGMAKSLKFSSIRDAAYTIALGTSLEQAKLLAGHRLAGSADHYVRRNPSMVADACAAIRKAFSPFPKPAKGKG